MTEKGRAIIRRPEPLEGEVLRRPFDTGDFKSLGEWIARGYAGGLVSVIDSTARPIEPREAEGAQDD
jgi:hypothetical protein